MKIKNILNQIKCLSERDIKNYGITEVFISDGELCTTSYYDLPGYLIRGIKEELNIGTSNE